MSSILPLLLQPLTHLSLPPPTLSPFTTHTILITGSNTGIGLASATHFARLGASRLILAVRSVASGLKAKRTIENAIASRPGENTTANTNTNTNTIIEVWHLDLSSFDSIKAFAERAKNLDKLHVAVMNAGKASTTWCQTQDGWEDMLQVNVLGTALLSLLLLPLLVRTAELENTMMMTMTAGQQQQQQPPQQPHLIIVGSGSHGDARLTHELSAPRILETLNDRTHCEEWKTSPVERYANTKLFGLYIAESLAALPYLSSPSSPSSSSAATAAATGRPKVIVSCVTPGFCKSELLSREPGVPWVLLVIQKLVGRSVLEGAKCVVDAAARGAESHGKYLDNQRLTTPVGLGVGEEGARVRERVWAELVDVLQRIAPEIMQVVG